MLNVRERRAVVTTAALRSAVAWSRRAGEARAWREVARMTGVIMNARGPGIGPVTPAELVALLHRPLGYLLPSVDEPSALDAVTLLDADGELSEAAMEIACDYNHALFDGRDPATEWLPRWAWQRAEQVERQAFQSLVQAGDQVAYTASRRFVVERPAGDWQTLAEERTNSKAYRGARLVAEYAPIPSERTFRFGSGDAGVCWWPCPVCRWPMRIQQQSVKCTYGPHQARFRITSPASAADAAPALVKTSAARLRTPPAHPVAGARCVDPAVWRFITVAGIPELLLERRLKGIAGVEVKMWPVKDTFDALVTAPDGHAWTVDVKDHTDAGRIADDPPAAQHVVVPGYRKGQVSQLARMLPGKQVWTIDRFCGHVRDHGHRGGAG
jgi:pPIWI_RE three-gene island domain Y/REase associating with pPIWI_RE